MDVTAFAGESSQVLATTEHNNALKRNLVRFLWSFEYTSKLDIQNPEPNSV